MRIIYAQACLIGLLLAVCGCRSVATKSQSKNSDDISVKVTFSVDPEGEGDISVDNSSLVFRIVNNGEKGISVPLGRPVKIDVVNEYPPYMHWDYFLAQPVRIGPGQSLLVVGFTLQDFSFRYGYLIPDSDNEIQARLTYWPDDSEEQRTLNASFKFHLGSEEENIGEEGDIVLDRKIPGGSKPANRKPHIIDLYLLDANGNIVRHFRIKRARGQESGKLPVKNKQINPIILLELKYSKTSMRQLQGQRQLCLKVC